MLTLNNLGLMVILLALNKSGSVNSLILTITAIITIITIAIKILMIIIIIIVTMIIITMIIEITTRKASLGVKSLK